MYEYADLIDNQDKVRTLIDPTSSYAIAAAYALGRDVDDEIIAAVDHGIYMETNRSWSIDDYRNKFQFGCEYGKLIENGKLTKTVKNPNYRAISNPFWNSLKMLGNQDTFEVYGTPYCGKGEPNQAIRVGHASPVCLFENVEVFGGV